MAYQALYRKWRPQTFEQVLGQTATVKTLRRQIEDGRIAHAYLFCGCRGTGKTTMAKLMSRAINCLNPNHGDPCGQCETCRAQSDGPAAPPFPASCNRRVRRGPARHTVGWPRPAHRRNRAGPRRLAGRAAGGPHLWELVLLFEVQKPVPLSNWAVLRSGLVQEAALVPALEVPFLPLEPRLTPA